MTQVIKVEGMKCKGCSSSVENLISDIQGVDSAVVNLDEKTVTIEGQKEIAKEEIQNAFKETKFTVA